MAINHRKPRAMDSDAAPGQRDQKRQCTDENGICLDEKFDVFTARRWHVEWMYSDFRKRWANISAYVRYTPIVTEVGHELCIRELDSVRGHQVQEMLDTVKRLVHRISETRLKSKHEVAEELAVLGNENIDAIEQCLYRVQRALSCHEDAFQQVQDVCDDPQYILEEVDDYEAEHAELRRQYQSVSKETRDSQNIDAETRALCQSSFASPEGDQAFEKTIGMLQILTRSYPTDFKTADIFKARAKLAETNTTCEVARRHLDELDEAVKAHLADDLECPYNTEVDEAEHSIQEGTVAGVVEGRQIPKEEPEEIPSCQQESDDSSEAWAGSIAALHQKDKEMVAWREELNAKLGKLLLSDRKAEPIQRVESKDGGVKLPLCERLDDIPTGPKMSVEDWLDELVDDVAGVPKKEERTMWIE